VGRHALKVFDGWSPGVSLFILDDYIKQF